MSPGFLLGALLDRSAGQKLGGEAAPQMARQSRPAIGVETWFPLTILPTSYVVN